MASPVEAVSRNVYWLSTGADVFAWEGTDFSRTPLAEYADLRALAHLPLATVDVTAEPRPARQGLSTCRLTVQNSTVGTPALGVHLAVAEEPRGAELGPGPVGPVRWSHNDVTLFAGQAVTLMTRYPARTTGRATVTVEGFNVAPQAVPVATT